MGAKIDRRFEELFSIMALNKTQSNNTTFYWDKLNKPLEYTIFRVPTDDENRRNMEDIPSEEI